MDSSEALKGGRAHLAGGVVGKLLGRILERARRALLQCRRRVGAGRGRRKPQERRAPHLRVGGAERGGRDLDHFGRLEAAGARKGLQRGMHGLEDAPVLVCALLEQPARRLARILAEVAPEGGSERAERAHGARDDIDVRVREDRAEGARNFAVVAGGEERLALGELDHAIDGFLRRATGDGRRATESGGQGAGPREWDGAKGARSVQGGGARSVQGRCKRAHLALRPLGVLQLLQPLVGHVAAL
eukprot:1904766-Prymnesium_polylepis.1